MSLKDAFNAFDAYKINDNVLRISNGCTSTYYDFAQRLMTVGHMTFTFSQLDRESLIEARDRLVALKGNPPELPPETPVAKAPAPKFNL